MAVSGLASSALAVHDAPASSSTHSAAAVRRCRERTFIVGDTGSASHREPRRRFYAVVPCGAGLLDAIGCGRPAEEPVQQSVSACGALGRGLAEESVALPQQVQ